MKMKLLLTAALTATLGFSSAFAVGPKRTTVVKAADAETTTTEYIDVTDLYATNCGFDIASDFKTSDISTSNGNNNTTYSATGWTIGSTSSWHGGGVLQIGSSYKCNSASTPSKNASNQATGGALALTAAWKGQVQYTQNVVLSVGSYEIEFAIYGSTGASINTNLLGYIQNDGTTHYGTTTSFTKGSWTTEKVSFSLTAQDEGKLTVGFKTPDKGSADNDKLFVDYVKIYQDKTSATTYAKSLVTEAQTKAKTALENASESTVKTALEKLANQEMPTTYEEMVALYKSINADIAGLSVAPNVDAIKNILSTYTTNVTDKLTTPSGIGTTTGQHWSGNTSTSYYDSWSGSASDVTLTFPEVTLPVGKYALLATGRSNTTTPGTLSVKVGDNEAVTTSIANNNSTGLGVDTNGNANASSDGTYANNGSGYGWQWSAVEFEVTDASQKVNISFSASLNSSWVSISDFKLLAQGVDTKEVLEALNTAKTEAQDVLDDVKSYYTGSEYEALNTLVSKENPTSYDDIVALTKEINAAVETLTSAAMPSFITSVKSSLPFDVTAKLGTATGDMVSNAGQHWSGDASRTYMEQSSAQWSATSWETSMTFPAVTLPAGNYALLATGRASASAEGNITVKVTDATGTKGEYEAIFPKNGDTGRGVDTDGHATNAADSTYCNNNAGRGWEYRAIKFTVAEGDMVTISYGGSSAAQYQWISISDFQLLSDVDIYKDENFAAFMTDWAKVETYVNSIVNMDSEGTGLKYSADDIDETNGIAQAYEISVEYQSMGEECTKNSNEIIADHAKCIAFVKEGLKALAEKGTLQSPAKGEKFNVIIAGNDGYNYNGKALTAKYNSTTTGNYSMGYTDDAGSYFSQAVEFEAVEGQTNTYVMSFIGADGSKLYVGTGVNYNGNNNQLRVVTDKDKALSVKVEVNVDDIYTTAPYRLFNTASSAYISANGANDSGFYTANSSYKNYQIVSAAEHECTLTVTDAKWATFIAPFDAELPSGVTAYSCSSVDTDNNLQLVKAESLKANTPYILYAENAVSSNLSGYACATAKTYTAGALTGTFEKIESLAKNANNYVLQKQTVDGAEEVAFFLVKDDNVICNANRAYLTVANANGVEAFHFAGEKTDGISNAALNGNATEVARYNAAGLRISAPVKGVNIVKFSDGRVVKQMVK